MNTDLNREIEKLFPALEIILPKETLIELTNATPDGIHLFHFGLGLFLRNSILNPDSRLYDKFISAGMRHKDDMSSMILKLLYEYLNTK